ncbi:PREDICTED: pentatricopeptide repeat-containing protein At2g36240 isoform X3 [Ipomoea nil]|uniref:pentatricopeptide repeat-containing protein At2g36240 isoform X3 n=1 Tax=Ipomoea nil TaxID=35883 RepID=UPI00090164D2|nr:PREDICTED: pentatricopeptide repeat-containing protein At2g36240 isoform X3 [Ipomoea nil]
MAYRKLPKQVPKSAAVHNPTPPSVLQLSVLDTTVGALPPATQTQLTRLVKTHLKPSFTPKDLLSFIRKHIHYHPTLTHLDFHLFRHAASVDSFRHDHSTFEWMARTLAVSHRLDSLSSLLQFIAANPCPCADGIFSCPRTEPIFRFAINAYCRSGKFDDALLAFDTMKRLIDGKPEMFKEMKNYGCVPNVVSFNTLIKRFLWEGKIEEGIGMAYEMIELGHEMSSVSCEILVDGLCRKGMINKACDLLVDFSRKGVMPSGFDYFAVVERLCDEGNVGRAMELVNELWRKGNTPSLIACITLIEGLRKARQIEEASKLVGDMLRECIVPDGVTFNCLLSDMCNAGKTVEANKLRMLGCSKGLRPDAMTYSILISGFTREGKRKEGEIVVDEMLDNGFIPDIFTYNRFMNELAKAKC